MTKVEKLIHRQRVFYQNKLQSQVAEIQFLSLEQDKLRYRTAVEDLHTTLVILWRFDRKLATLRNEVAQSGT